jgi:hypothetical protein
VIHYGGGRLNKQLKTHVEETKNSFLRYKSWKASAEKRNFHTCGELNSLNINQRSIKLLSFHLGMSRERFSSLSRKVSQRFSEGEPSKFWMKKKSRSSSGWNALQFILFWIKYGETRREWSSFEKSQSLWSLTSKFCEKKSEKGWEISEKSLWVLHAVT